jgi:TRAP transporter TAXI family solute receptor
MMKDGQIDYLTFNTSTNASMIMDAATSPGIRFLEFGPKEKAQLIKELPGTSETVIPKDMYPGIEKDYHTLAAYYLTFVSKDMPEELAYRITKVIWDNLEGVQAVGAFGKYIKLETAFEGMTIPMHPGAARYYKEKGMTPPEPKRPKL